jgi:carbonic anhydrase
MVTVNLNESDINQKALLSNIIFTTRVLANSRPVLSEAIKNDEIKIIGAVYDLSTGKVNWLEH